jgi:hypothetical protein
MLKLKEEAYSFKVLKTKWLSWFFKGTSEWLLQEGIPELIGILKFWSNIRSLSCLRADSILLVRSSIRSSSYHELLSHSVTSDNIGKNGPDFKFLTDQIMIRPTWKMLLNNKMYLQWFREGELKVWYFSFARITWDYDPRNLEGVKVLNNEGVILHLPRPTITKTKILREQEPKVYIKIIWVQQESCKTKDLREQELKY